MSETFSTTRIDLLRHGECEGGAIFRGNNDVALLESGYAQMLSQCKKLGESWQLIISSPLRRCLAFSEAFSAKKHVALQVDDRLKEMSFGDWEGRPINEIWQNEEALMQAWMQDPGTTSPPNAEPLFEVKTRVKQLLDDVYNQHKGKNILIVSHGGIIRVILAHILSMPDSAINQLDVPYACVSRFATYDSANKSTTKLLAHNFI